MIELAEIWADVGQRYHAAVEGEKKCPFPVSDAIGHYGPLLVYFARPAQIVVEKTDDPRGPIFQLHPRPDVASDKSWAWLLAVRGGYADWLFQLHGTKAHSVWARYADACAEEPEYRASCEALLSTEMIDILAYSADFSRCHGRLLNQAVVIGHPQYPEMAAGAPVRLFKNVLTWLAARCGGAVLVGSAEENLDWLRRCDSGIVCDDIAHGTAVQKILKRDYDGPKVLVAQ